MRNFRGLGAPVPIAPSGAGAAGSEGSYVAERKDFYVYEAQCTALAASAQSTDTIQIEADSNFILQKFAYHCQAPAATMLAASALGLVEAQRIIPPVAIQLIDTGSGRQLMQNPIPIPSLFGNGQLPFILPNPRMFLRNSTIQVAFTNLDVTNAYTVRLAFIGFKVYGTA
jgi:hypothetical protein